MRCRQFGAVGALLALLGAATAHAEPYPDWKGQWLRKSAGTFDPDKSFGLGQKAPLTPEYQKVLEDSVADQAAGGQGNNPMAACIPPGMPRMMIGYGGGFEFISTPEITYAIQGEPMLQLRRIFTDGRAWPKEREPSYAGFSIGQWEGTDRDGRFDTLAIETRWIKGPHSYDDSGIPLHADEQAVIKERISSDKSDPRLLHNEITTVDNALTRPWTVTQSYRRAVAVRPLWTERVCSEDGQTIRIGEEDYALSDGLLMPVRKGQPPPDLRYFGLKQN